VHQVGFIYKIIQVCTASKHSQDVPSCLCLEAVNINLHETYQCRIYSGKLLMMGKKMPETRRVL
jgi:hypothetical protein